MATQNIILIGLMAVGKTTIGRLLADTLGWQFFDTDHEIESRAGADIPWIFDVEGEAGFRDREQAVIAELTKCRGIVLATGGGAVLRAENRRQLAARGTVVFLDSSLNRLLERTRKDKKRPLLQAQPGVTDHDKVMQETLRRLRRERGPLYQEIADYSFTTDNANPRALARRIEQRLRADGVIAGPPGAAPPEAVSPDQTKS